jgi:hypothetical protein
MNTQEDLFPRRESREQMYVDHTTARVTEIFEARERPSCKIPASMDSNEQQLLMELIGSPNYLLLRDALARALHASEQNTARTKPQKVSRADIEALWQANGVERQWWTDHAAEVLRWWSEFLREQVTGEDQ